jgi:hypothetical protein
MILPACQKGAFLSLPIAIVQGAAATAKTHVSRLLMKLNAHDRAQLVMIAYETGLVTPGT